MRDSNFKQILSVIRRNLGNFHRRSYIVLFDVTEAQIEEYRRENINVINLRTDGRSRGQLLEEFLNEIYEYTTFSSAKRIEFSTRAKQLEDNKLKEAIRNNSTDILESTSELCFVIMKPSQENNLVYFDAINPAVEKYGLRPLRAEDLPSRAGPLVDDIRTAILHSKLIICDITSRDQYIMYQLGIAIQIRKSIILLSQAEAPLDLDNFHFSKYQNTPKGLYHSHKRPVPQSTVLHRKICFPRRNRFNRR